jgi:hypothetical protein
MASSSALGRDLAPFRLRHRLWKPRATPDRPRPGAPTSSTLPGDDGVLSYNVPPVRDTGAPRLAARAHTRRRRPAGFQAERPRASQEPALNGSMSTTTPDHIALQAAKPLTRLVVVGSSITAGVRGPPRRPPAVVDHLDTVATDTLTSGDVANRH